MVSVGTVNRRSVRSLNLVGENIGDIPKGQFPSHFGTRALLIKGPPNDSIGFSTAPPPGSRITRVSTDISSDHISEGCYAASVFH